MTIREYDIVALTEDVRATHSETQQAIMLRRGQVGTVLMCLDDEAFLVDFADNKGQTYATETIPSQKVMRLLHEPVLAVA